MNVKDNVSACICNTVRIYYYENLLSLKIRPFYEIFILRKFGAIRYYIPYSGFFTRHYFRKLLFSWTTYNYFDAIDSVQKYVPIKDE